MATTTYERAWKEIERMEAEYGGELPDLNVAGGPSLADRARRLLDCGANLADDEATLCRGIVDGTLPTEE